MTCHASSSYRSRQAGFIASISASFLRRDPALICFSRAIARGHVVVRLVPDEERTAIACGESRHRSVAMLVHALQEIGGDAGVERAVASACHDVNGGLLHRLSLACPALQGLVSQAPATPKSLRGAQRRSNPAAVGDRSGWLRCARHDAGAPGLKRRREGVALACLPPCRADTFKSGG
jgi:hypothetical protein